MNRFSSIALQILLLLVLVLPVWGENQEGKLPHGSQLLGIARGDGVDPPFDQHLKGELDKLVPKLKQLNEEATILIEAYYPEKKGKGRDHQVSMSFSLAEQVQQYLKTVHSLDRDFFVAVWKDPDEKPKNPIIRLTTYPRDYFEN